MLLSWPLVLPQCSDEDGIFLCESCFTHLTASLSPATKHDVAEIIVLFEADSIRVHEIICSSFFPRNRLLYCTYVLYLPPKKTTIIKMPVPVPSGRSFVTKNSPHNVWKLLFTISLNSEVLVLTKYQRFQKNTIERLLRKAPTSDDTHSFSCSHVFW